MEKVTGRYPGYAKVLDRMRMLCSRREYCRADMMKKAREAFLRMTDDEGLAVEAAEAVVEALVEDRYLDDLRYASAFARDKSSISGWGHSKIRYALSMKLVDREVITEALKEIDEEAAGSRLMKLIENKYRTLKDDPQCRLKLLRFGIGRGYGYDQVNRAIDRLTEI